MQKLMLFSSANPFPPVPSCSPKSKQACMGSYCEHMEMPDPLRCNSVKKKSQAASSAHHAGFKVQVMLKLMRFPCRAAAKEAFAFLSSMGRAAKGQ